MTANTVFIFASICIATALRICLIKENKKLDAAEEQQIQVMDIDGKGRDEIIQQNAGGVLRLNPGFRYCL